MSLPSFLSGAYLTRRSLTAGPVPRFRSFPVYPSNPSIHPDHEFTTASTFGGEWSVYRCLEMRYSPVADLVGEAFTATRSITSNSFIRSPDCITPRHLHRYLCPGKHAGPASETVPLGLPNPGLQGRPQATSRNRSPAPWYTGRLLLPR